LASNFSSDPADLPVPHDTPATGGAPDASEVSAATMKFRSCRWRRPPEDGAECCTHRDVLPIAGSSGFKPEAWCPDCQYFKLRRSPRKREREPDPWGL
jgi:hypothetical protein